MAKPLEIFYHLAEPKMFIIESSKSNRIFEEPKKLLAEPLGSSEPGVRNSDLKDWRADKSELLNVHALREYIKSS